MMPIISLTTDFGLRDPFVGVMKGVIAGICPAARIIDLTHGVEAFSILDGALAVWQSWRYFPADTIHAIVVDPGVGSERKPVLVSMGGQWFIAPDNGVLTLVEREVRRAGEIPRSWIIANPAYMLQVRSNTFHGRDIFAPAAAHLACQLAAGSPLPNTCGPAVNSLLQLPVAEPVTHPDGSTEGIILKADKFGNLLTNIPGSSLPPDLTGRAIEIGSVRITRFAHFYAEAEPGELFAIQGSSGLLELAMNRGSALEALKVSAGAKFRLAGKSLSPGD